ncbi:MAG: FkbM family methyltransferase [Magnetococcales bacterium]|nr:FkbM family methyltransferase [Magnetococcales bacterium]
MSISHRLIRHTVTLMDRLLNATGQEYSERLKALLLEYMVPIRTVSDGITDFRFYCPGIMPLWRAHTLLTKETETIEWINDIASNEVLWDVGANVGVYSIYAAVKHRVQVVAFEPSAVNFATLVKNIEINGLDEQVLPFCIALARLSEIGALNMSSTVAGNAISNFGPEAEPMGQTFEHAGHANRVTFRQGVLGFSIDDFIRHFNPPFPNHIKIDVDGIEGLIIQGAQTTFADPRLKSALIELDTGDRANCDTIINAMSELGLTLMEARHSEMFDGAAYDAVYNHIFIRN